MPAPQAAVPSDTDLDDDDEGVPPDLD